MRYIFRMAWRNLTRSRARTILSLGAVALGVMVVIMFKGFEDGMINMFLNNSIRLNSGHVRVIQQEYRRKERLLPLAYPVDGFSHEGYKAMTEEFTKIPGVQRVFGRIRFGALVSKREQNEGVMGIGVEPAAEEAEAQLYRYIDQGRFVQEGQKEIVLGKNLLEKLRIKVGDRVTILANDSFGSLRMASYTVVGRLNSGLRFLDEGVAYLPIDRAQVLLGLQDSATEILIYGKDETSAAQLQKRVEQVLRKESPGQGYLAIPWYSHNAMISYINNAKAALYIIYGFVVLLACFVVLNTFIMIVSERRREIGMLGAMGFTRKEVLLLFLVEAGVVGLLGSLAGMGIGSLLNWWLSSTGLDLSAYTKAMGKEFLFFPRLYPELSWATNFFAFFLGWSVTLLAGVIPARRAARIEPTQALKSI